MDLSFSASAKVRIWTNMFHLDNFSKGDNMKHTGNQVFWRAARRVGIFLIGIELAAALIIPGLS